MPIATWTIHDYDRTKDRGEYVDIVASDIGGFPDGV